MTVIEMGRELAGRGLPALVWNMEELDALLAAQKADASDEAATLKAHRNRSVSLPSGIHFHRCGGGWRVVRRKKGGDS